MSRKISVGIIGFGLSGKAFHAPFIAANHHFNLKAIVSGREKEIKSIYPEVEVLFDKERLFNDPHIDLIIIATPNKFHFEEARKALESGKHVIIDKPFAATSDDADKLIKLAKTKNKILSIYHNRRLDGDFLTVKKIIDKHLLGDLIEYEAHFDRYRPHADSKEWKNTNDPASGIVYDLGSHLIDQALCLFGLPKWVWADIRKIRPGTEVDDYFHIQMGYFRTFVRLKAGIYIKEATPRYILNGTKGTFVKFGTDPQEEDLKNGKTPDSPKWGKDKLKFYGLLHTEKNGKPFKGRIETICGNYAGYYENIYNAVINGQELMVEPKQARDVIKIIEMAYESNKEKKAIGWK